MVIENIPNGSRFPWFVWRKYTLIFFYRNTLAGRRLRTLPPPWISVYAYTRTFWHCDIVAIGHLGKFPCIASRMAIGAQKQSRKIHSWINNAFRWWTDVGFLSYSTFQKFHKIFLSMVGDWNNWCSYIGKLLSLWLLFIIITIVVYVCVWERELSIVTFYSLWTRCKRGWKWWGGRSSLVAIGSSCGHRGGGNGGAWNTFHV